MSAARRQGKQDESDSRRDIGERIKRLRKEAGLRQWQMAEMIGATQPAIHMYERGVLPEPRRLLQLARIGGTTVEWILTGKHWDGGSEEMRRPSDAACALAWQVQEITAEDRTALEEATRIIGAALRGLEKSAGRKAEALDLESLALALKSQPQAALSALEAALKVHEATRAAVLAQGAERLRRSGSPAAGSVAAGADPREGGHATRKGAIRPSSLEPLRGHIFRLDGQLLVIRDILGDRTLRAELEEALARLSSRLKSGKSALSGEKKTRKRA